MNLVITLPAGLSPSTGTWMASLVQRNQATDASTQLFLSKAFAFSGTPNDSYLLIASQSRFAWGGQLTADFLAATAAIAITNALPALPPEVPNPPSLVAGLQVQLTGPDLILDEVSDFDALAGALLVFVDNEIMSVDVTTLTAAGAYSLTVIRGMFGTAIADHDAGADIFIVRRTDIVPFTHPSFQTGNTPVFKILTGAGTLADATAAQPPTNAPVITSIGPPDSFAATLTGVLRLYGTGFTNNGDEVVHLASFDYSGGDLEYYDDGHIEVPEIDFALLGLAPGVYPVSYTNDLGTSNSVNITID